MNAATVSGPSASISAARAWPEQSSQLARSWNPIEVPGCWTRQHVGDWPHYTNIIMPWHALEAPETPEHNPTGLYHRSFDLPLVRRVGHTEMHCQTVALALEQDAAHMLQALARRAAKSSRPWMSQQESADLPSVRESSRDFAAPID